MTTDPAGLLQKYRRKHVIFDANVLLVYLVGTVNEALLRRNHHTKQYADDFHLIRRLVEFFDKKVTTPNTLTEVSNLGKDCKDAFYSRLSEVASTVDEVYCSSREACTDNALTRLGLTDAALCRLAGDHLIITTDFPLYQVVVSRGFDAINFHHLRQATWSEGHNK